MPKKLPLHVTRGRAWGIKTFRAGYKTKLVVVDQCLPLDTCRGPRIYTTRQKARAVLQALAPDYRKHFRVVRVEYSFSWD